MDIKYFHHKSFERSLRELEQKGGRDKIKAAYVWGILGKKILECPIRWKCLNQLKTENPVI